MLCKLVFHFTLKYGENILKDDQQQYASYPRTQNQILRKTLAYIFVDLDKLKDKLSLLIPNQ